MVSLRYVLGDQVTRILLRLGFINLYHYTIYGNPNRVKLGRNVELNNALLNVASGRIIIGDNVFFGHSVMLITGTHDYRKVALERQRAWPKFGRDIVIEDGVMIGSGAIVLGNVRIGKNAVIGAGSLVNTNVDPDTFVAGIPARPIRKIIYVQNEKLLTNGGHPSNDYSTG